MVSTRALAALALAIALAGTAAQAAPTISGNTPDRCVKGLVLDTLEVPNNAARTIFLLDAPAGGVRSNIDSLVNVWHNGGATPAFRRIQRIMFWNSDQAAANTQRFDLTIYRDGATSRNKGFAIWPFSPAINLPIEADSIRVTSHTVPLDLGMAYW